MEKLVLPKFNGKNFAVWRFQIESFLAVHDLLEVVDSTLKCPSEASRLDWKARLVIGNALETNIVRLVMNLKTANKMWTWLSSLYKLRNKTTIHLLLQKFLEYRMEEGMTISQHDEVAIITKTLHSLSAKYRHIISTWDTMLADQQIMTNLLTRLLNKEALEAR
ncbi:hypothetical protein X777_02818 [Ooceraea biroi]|uniref:Copia protein n=1 Tax=Ooceraea biroi TaxID=2015173 RepID=A0A026X1Q1_OOCBI|nr:hypothetical protein X777_02818 [Ooceraea biroi]